MNPSTVTKALYITHLCQLVLYSTVLSKEGQQITLSISGVYPLADAERVLRELGLESVTLGVM